MSKGTDLVQALIDEYGVEMASSAQAILAARWDALLDAGVDLGLSAIMAPLNAAAPEHTVAQSDITEMMNDPQYAALFSPSPDLDFTVTASANTVDEGQTVTYTIESNVPVDTDTSFTWAVIEGGSADADDIEGANAGSATILAGETTATFTIAAAADNVSEFQEAFVVEITDAEGALVDSLETNINSVWVDLIPPTVNAGQAFNYVENQEADAVIAQVEASDDADGEGIASFEITNNVVDGNGDPLFAINDAGEITFTEAGLASDYNDFEAGNAPVELTVTATDAAGNVSDETVVTLNVDNDETDGGANFSISDATLDPEGDNGEQNLDFTIELSAAQENDVTVDYVTADGTATAGTDYTETTGTATIPAGDTSVTVSVPVQGDLDLEDDETFTVTLSNPSEGVILDAEATGTIVDDDTGPSEISIQDVAVLEGDTGTTTATFTVALSVAPEAGDTVTVDWVTSSGGPNGSAAAGIDYVAATGTVTFNEGDLTQTFDVTVNGDTLNETIDGLGENFTVQLSNITGTVGGLTPTFANNTATGTITNDDYSQVFTLTTGADNVPEFQGTGGNDTFIATEDTLSSADELDGADGTDTLIYSASDTGAAVVDVNEQGFQTNSIETFRVTSDVGNNETLTFDMTGATGAATYINDNSNDHLVTTGVKNLVDVQLQDVTGGDTTVRFNDSVLAGASDALNLTLDNVAEDNGNAVSEVFLGNTTSAGTAGIETLNVITSGAPSNIQDITTGAATINITGDQDLTIFDPTFPAGAPEPLDGATTIDASTFGGSLTVVPDSNVFDVAVTTNTGDDYADFSLGFDAGDTFDGGTGTNTLGVTNAIATGAPGGSTTNVQQLNVTTAGTGIIDMDNFAGFTRVIYDAGLTNGATSTVDDTITGVTVEVDAGVTATANLTVDLLADGASDEVTVLFDEVGGPNPAAPAALPDQIGTLTVDDAETLNITLVDDPAVLAMGSFQLTNLNLNPSDTTTLNVSGDTNFTLVGSADPATPLLTTIDGTGLSGNFSLSNTNTAAAGATISFGGGNDTFNVATSSGADTITLGSGADTIRYTAVAQSDRDMDTITDFVSGTDLIDLSYDAAGNNTDWNGAAAGGTFILSNQFVGNRATFAQAQGALSATGVSVVFQQDESILWLDSDADGTLDNTDFRVKLDGVTSITAADLGFVVGNTITLNAQGAFVDLTPANLVSANAVSTNNDDTVTSTYANLVGSTVDGANGVDTLNVTDAVTAIFNFNPLVTNIEAFNLQGGSTAAVTIQNGAGVTTTASTTATVTLGTGGQTYTGSDQVDTLTLGATGTDTDTVNVAGGDDTVNDSAGNSTVTLGAGADTFVAAAGADNVTGDAGADTFTMAGNLTVADTLDGGADADILTITDSNAATDLNNVTNIETVNITTTAATGLTTVDAFGAAGGAVTINHAVTGGVLTFNAGADLDTDFTFGTVASAFADIITGGAGNDTFNYQLNTVIATLTGGAGDDTFNLGANLLLTDVIDGGIGNDTVTVTASNATTDLDGITNVETIEYGAAAFNHATNETLVAAGATINFDATAMAANALTLDLALETDGQVNVNLTGTTGGSNLTFTSNNLVDTYTLSTAGAGVDVIVLDANNTVANVGNADEIINFKAVGADTLDSGTADTGGIVFDVSIDNTTVASFAGDVNAALATAGYASSTAEDVFTVTVTNSGNLNGFYAIQDVDSGGAVDVADFIVELQGTTGAIAAADFV